MNSVDNYEDLLREEMHRAVQSVSAEVGASPQTIADRYAAGRRRKVARGVFGAVMCAAVLAVGTTLLIRPAPAAPDRAASRSIPAASTTSEVVVRAPRTDGADVSYAVTISSDSGGAQVVRADSLGSNDTGRTRTRRLAGTVVTTTGGDVIAIIPKYAGATTLLDPDAPDGAAQASAPQDIAGIPFEAVVFSYAGTRSPQASIPAVLYRQADGRLSTGAEDATTATIAFTGSQQGLWALPKSGWVGLLVDGSPTVGTAVRAPSADLPVVKVGMAADADHEDGPTDGTAFVIRGTVRPGSVTVDRTSGSTASTTTVHALGPGLTAVIVVVEGARQGTWQGHAIRSIGWQDQDGAPHTWTP